MFFISHITSLELLLNPNNIKNWRLKNELFLEPQERRGHRTNHCPPITERQKVLLEQIHHQKLPHDPVLGKKKNKQTNLNYNWEFLEAQHGQFWKLENSGAPSHRESHKIVSLLQVSVVNIWEKSSWVSSRGKGKETIWNRSTLKRNWLTKA